MGNIYLKIFRNDLIIIIYLGLLEAAVDITDF